ncbi:unconventional prefoldin RPB5 interactor isoform X2 [Bicyclus anynana]|uniref:Unconventional prefoldin RPB5 interactor isoform X2 n=1 Tax=Bicyclus anynana TaxID=110368 RepID=A0ABM3LKJ9_BICAN|nr:unconventional prefoldin RPB5 interactor isoform X2 [Bicyclus anynana]
MNILDDIYKNSLQRSEKNIKFWEEYLQNLTSLDFSVYSDKLSVPILVPIDAKCKLETLNKEKEYLESQISFGKGTIHDNQGQDIIEECSEEEDKVWREQHREKVREYYQNKKNKKSEKSPISDEDLWSRLEELELQEELENELSHDGNQRELDDSDANVYDSFIIKEDDVSNIPVDQTTERQDVPHITHNFPKNTSKVDLLLQVIDRQKMLEEKLSELKTRDRVETKTESDLMSRLDEMEQIDELEDEMNRLDEIIDEDDEEVTNDSVKSEDTTKVTRSVSFADQYDGKTIEINFKHSNIGGPEEDYVEEKGITKPSDIYKAYSTLFSNETSSILKKSKYDDKIDNVCEHVVTDPIKVPQHVGHVDDVKTIVVKDVIERSDNNENKVCYDTRPTSLFKKKRQQQKS